VARSLEWLVFVGRALAERFLENGDFVIGTSTSGSSSIEHERLLMLQLDLASHESIVACSRSIFDTGKGIDVLINNAGIWSGIENDPIIHVDLLRKVLEVNLFGTVDFTEGIVGIMNSGGHIVNISSRMGSIELVPKMYLDCPDYKISKAALNMVTRILSVRLAGKITVSSVHPGWVKTDMGGGDADIEPKEAAEDIFKLANSRPETGQFWFKGEKFPW
jgi:NAD(P)-dependent dehydrogenase (short-subunit alcohol dehydrogenase family)